jgi:hypothetical protein
VARRAEWTVVASRFVAAGSSTKARDDGGAVVVVAAVCSYEAYVIYMFFALCINYGGGYDNLVQKLMAQPPFYLAVPFCMWKVQPGG